MTLALCLFFVHNIAMPFSPELQDQINSVRTDNPRPFTLLGKLKSLLEKREGQPGFKANAEALREKIAQLEAENG